MEPSSTAHALGHSSMQQLLLTTVSCLLVTSSCVGSWVFLLESGLHDLLMVLHSWIRGALEQYDQN